MMEADLKERIVRYKYRTMTADEFGQALKDANLTARQFARLSGANYRRIVRQLEENEAIPHFYRLLLELLRLPGAVEIAKQIADETIIEETPE